MIEKRETHYHSDGTVAGQSVSEAYCDICGESCMVDIGGTNSFEGLELHAHWGYGSNDKDTETWKACVCEKCTDKYLVKLINFNKTNYM